MIHEHEQVVLTADVPAEGLQAGDVGTVVHVYCDGHAYEVEFVTLDGHTASIVTLEASTVRRVSPREVTHARELSAVSTAPVPNQQQPPPAIRARLSGRLDMIRASDKDFALILKDGRRIRGMWLGQDMLQLGEYLDKAVVMNGTMVYQPYGSPLRFDAETVDSAGPADDFFSKVPAPARPALPPPSLRQPQSPVAGMQAVFGKWPGDETDEEVLRMLEEIE